MPFLTSLITQGGADAFVQTSIATGLLGQTDRAYQILELSFEFVFPVMFAPAAANQEVELTLTRRTKAAVPNFTDKDVFYKWKWGQTGATAVGSFVQPLMSQQWRPPAPLLIVEDPIYCQLDSTATTITQIVDFRIEYEIVRISEVDRLTLLTLSLQ